MTTMLNARYLQNLGTRASRHPQAWLAAHTYIQANASQACSTWEGRIVLVALSALALDKGEQWWNYCRLIKSKRPTKSRKPPHKASRKNIETFSVRRLKAPLTRSFYILALDVIT